MTQETLIIPNQESTTPTSNNASFAAIDGSPDQTSAPEFSFSLILNYYSTNASKDNYDKSGMRIVEDNLLEFILQEKTDNEEANKVRQELAGRPTRVEENPETRAAMLDCLNEVATLYEEIHHKRTDLIAVNAVLKNKLQGLEHDKKITINYKVFDNNEASISRYIQLLEELINELHEEFKATALLVQCKHIYIAHEPTVKPSHHPLQLLEKRIKDIKRYVKNVRREINVSYSRYSFGLDTQTKRIAYFEKASKGDQAL